MTELLGEYANDVKEIIGDKKGKLVYAGGDDILAFVNLSYLFDVLKCFRERFPKFEKIKSVELEDKKSSPLALFQKRGRAYDS